MHHSIAEREHPNPVHFFENNCAPVPLFSSPGCAAGDSALRAVRLTSGTLCAPHHCSSAPGLLHRSRQDISHFHSHMDAGLPFSWQWGVRYGYRRRRSGPRHIVSNHNQQASLGLWRESGPPVPLKLINSHRPSQSSAPPTAGLLHTHDILTPAPPPCHWNEDYLRQNPSLETF